jgi:hypothetical protein
MFGLQPEPIFSVLWQLVRRCAVFERSHSLVFLLIAGLAFAQFTHHLPLFPWALSDSESYINFSPVRPHGYSLFLAGYRLLVSEDLAYLPAVQAALLFGAMTLLSMAVGRRLNSFPAAILVFILLYAYLDVCNAAQLMSEGLYVPAITAACGMMLFYAHRPRVLTLVLASTLIGLAVTCRTIGYGLIPAFLVPIAMHAHALKRRALHICALATLPIMIACGGAAASNWVHNGSYSIGSWGGVSLLGKALVLAEPLPADSDLARLNWTGTIGNDVRSALNRIESPILKALAARQYYEYLRWGVAWPRFPASWPAWRDGNQAERGRLAGQLAREYVKRNLRAYAKLAALDYLSLWLLPAYLTEHEHTELELELTALGDLPYLSAFGKTLDGKLDYFQIVPPPRAVMLVWSLRLAVFCFWALSLISLVQLGRSWRILVITAPDRLFVIFAIHGTYLATALAEAGLERYAMQTWPMLVAGIVTGCRLIVSDMPRGVQIPQAALIPANNRGRLLPP